AQRGRHARPPHQLHARGRARLPGPRDLRPQPPAGGVERRGGRARAGPAGASDGQGNQHRIRRASFVQSVNLGIKSVYQQVTIPKTRFTLSSRQGPIGIRVVNNSDQRLTLVIRVSSPKVDVPSGNQPLSPQFVVEPRSGKIQELQVSTRTPGTFPIQVEAFTPDGAFAVASTEMILTSTAFSRFGLILTGGAAGFLLLWWSRRLGRRGGRPSRRRRRGDPGGGGGGGGG